MLNCHSTLAKMYLARLTKWWLNFFQTGRNYVLAEIENLFILSVEITNKMKPCNKIYYSTVYWRLNMFRAVYRSIHVGPSISVRIINSITRLHLVGYFYWFILRCTDPWILNLLIVFGMQKCCNAFFSVQNMWLEHEGENIDIDIK